MFGMIICVENAELTNFMTDIILFQHLLYKTLNKHKQQKTISHYYYIPFCYNLFMLGILLKVRCMIK